MDISDAAFMEFANRIDLKYCGPTVNWAEVDKTKLYLRPTFSDKCMANQYTQKYEFTSDADFDYVKAEVQKFGRKPMEGTNKILLILICKK